jgi:hypothetical protein
MWPRNIGSYTTLKHEFTILPHLDFRGQSQPSRDLKAQICLFLCEITLKRLPNGPAPNSMYMA